MKTAGKDSLDVIVVGELNVNLANAMTLTLGSSSAIFASNLSALGMNVSFIGKIGDDIFGRYCKNQLEAKGVDTSMLLMNNKLKTGATVVLNFGEDRAMITHPGAMKYLGLMDISKEMLSRARHLHFSSYFLQPGFKHDLFKLFSMAKELGLYTSLDIKWDPAEQWDFDFKKILPFVDVFLPNEKELLNLTKQDSVSKAISLTRDYGKQIVVKKGKEGSLLCLNNQLISCASFLNEQVVDAIGAGDSFNAGYIFRYLRDFDPQSCQVFANLMGAISTTKPGGTTAFINYQHTMNMAKEKFGYEEWYETTTKIKRTPPAKEAILATNFYNFETLKGVLQAAQSVKKSMILQLTRSSIEYLGLPVSVKLA